MKITIEVGDIDVSNAEDSIYRIVAERIQARLAGPIAERAREALDSTAREMMRERLEAEIEHVITEGWTPTSSYGEPRGAKVTLKERISKTLTEKTRTGGYNSPEYTIVETVVQTTVKATIDKEFADVIKEAKARFKAAVDAEVMGRIAEAVKTVLVK
jgi:hypothetical protein